MTGEGPRALLGWLLGLVARVWLATLRVRVVCDPALESVRGRPWVLAFWHGTQWPLLAWRRRGPTVVMVSLSRDGALQARALAVQGLRVVRGSTSRGGARALAALVRAMKRLGADAAFAVDGPRGPRGIVKAGAVLAAQAAGGVLVPMAGHVRRGLVFQRAWDRFALAWPFTRVDVVLGAPIDPSSADPRAALEHSLAILNAEIPTSVHGPRSLERFHRRLRAPRLPLVGLGGAARSSQRDVPSGVAEWSRASERQSSRKPRPKRASRGGATPIVTLYPKRKPT
jgi:lysophospholipid acyltransferase (LPLAT)-like uncharacterized protein